MVLGTLPALSAAAMPATPPRPLGPEDFWITEHPGGSLLVAGLTARGALYGAFALVRQLAIDPTARFDAGPQGPAAAIRWVNQWDNLDGTIERGYGGRSIFFDERPVSGRPHARRATTRGCSRRSASTACSINNVNANPRVLIADASAAARARRRRVPPVGRPARASRSTSAARRRSAGSTPSTRSTRRRRLVEGTRRRRLRRRSRISAGSC